MHTRIVTHYLEMTAPSALRRAGPPRTPFALARAEIPSPELSRFLYTAVGSTWYWTDRLEWTYARWLEHLQRDGVETHVAWVRGTPAGYFELNPHADGDVEIAYLGLLPGFTGQGIGGALLTAAIERAWELGARRVWLHTCTLDHPSALPVYLARGFRVFKVVESERDLPEKPAGPWPGALP